jgi:hypothetical protein
VAEPPPGQMGWSATTPYGLAGHLFGFFFFLFSFLDFFLKKKKEKKKEMGAF